MASKPLADIFATVADLEQLIKRMEQLGGNAEDAAARVNDALARSLPRIAAEDGRALVSAIGDVIDIVTERSLLAHEAHRLIRDLRRDALMRSPAASRNGTRH